ncbi:regulatory protein GntR [Azotobacter vinelandii CA]|uniref:Bacterial regulatory protein, GntR n=2 Tax=Azotobacter vinelandii TaxID=354 RepID=C1DRA4_AZOVD|nr:PLP-dependent aminotransferase family protein [Azotobacter vinelandii]ACO79762.1 Bacterial regulatory protein, GntR [Azotobacter vinelandii DJ]AGK16229.1 regulatory protein GntR [Azotobacter vinelandii CA]AGK21480.1 regulatory protein GntR [Azotobacter vinelandii CA6]WKN20550.1 PLP-dependent aminotransferase family protein [Azotobacter vinelandii]SFY34254.1 transcriptional regulator, GntR family [Azotobacter vinelandii]
MPRITLAQQVADSVERQIHEGVLKVGDRLPSLREYMRLHGHSKNTVITAYELLASKGLVEARHGQGFFVRAAPVNTAEPDEALPYARAMDTIWMMRQQFVREPGQAPLGEGFPPVSWLQDMRLDRFTKQVMRSGAGSLFRYGNRLGNPALRQSLVRKLASYAISTTPRQIVTTHGANHALDLIIRRFVAPGDSVLVENPGYYPLFGKLQLQGARMLSVPRLPDGPDMVALEALLRTERPRLFFIQSIGHNPTGSDISPAKAHQLLQLAERHDLILVEDDALADFKPSSSLKVSALDQLRRSLYIGSFSKSVSAALRVGYIAGSKEMIDELADLKMLLHTSSSELCERTVDVILSEGHFLRHLTRLQDRVREATLHGLNVLDELGVEVFCRPEQSLYLWARFPGVWDSSLFTQEVQAQGLTLAPGAIFKTDQKAPTPWTRLNVAYVGEPLFAQCIRSYGALAGSTVSQLSGAI